MAAPAAWLRALCWPGVRCWQVQYTSVTVHSLERMRPYPAIFQPVQMLNPVLQLDTRGWQLRSAHLPRRTPCVLRQSLERSRSYASSVHECTGTTRCPSPRQLNAARLRRPPRRPLGAHRRRRLTPLPAARSPRWIPCLIPPRRGLVGSPRWLACCSRESSARISLPPPARRQWWPERGPLRRSSRRRLSRR